MVGIPGEGVCPKCVLCNMQPSPWDQNYEWSAFCREGQERLTQHEALAKSALALEIKFTAHCKELERVEVFKCMGRLLSFNNNDIPIMQSNMRSHP